MCVFVCERGADLVDEKMMGYLFACVLRGVARHEEVFEKIVSRCPRRRVHV